MYNKRTLYEEGQVSSSFLGEWKDDLEVAGVEPDQLRFHRLRSFPVSSQSLPLPVTVELPFVQDVAIICGLSF